MKGLVIWAQSACRSQMALYRELGRALAVPVEVAVWYYAATPGEANNRSALGFSDNEFSDMTVLPVGEDWQRACRVLDGHFGWNHLVCNYQGSAVYRRVLVEAKRRGMCVAVGSESPCNMMTGWRRLAKEIYYRTKLPKMVRHVVNDAAFLANYSGTDDRLARLIGWPAEKIIPFGYFSPPIPGTKAVRRVSNRPFEILATGELTDHRGSDVLVRALSRLSRKGVPYHATITQKGPLLDSLKRTANREHLPIDFTGFMPLLDLHRAYESCSVYVGAGRHEPWGMRLNDALNCGAPLVVSRGMGGVKMVDDFGCGLSFANEDADDLARQLERLATDESLYARCAQMAFDAVDKISPEYQAKVLVSEIGRRFPEWLK